MIRGIQTNLRAVERSDARFLCALLNQPSVQVGWGSSGVPVSIHRIESDIETWIERERELARPSCLIIESLERETVGVLMIDVSRRFNQSMATLSIAISEESQHLGFGSDALQGVLDALFADWGVHRIQVRCEAENQHAIRLYESLGFAREATRRHGTFADGAFRDQHVFGLLVTDVRPEPS